MSLGVFGGNFGCIWVRAGHSLWAGAVCAGRGVEVRREVAGLDDQHSDVEWGELEAEGFRCSWEIVSFMISEFGITNSTDLLEQLSTRYTWQMAHRLPWQQRKRG